MANLTHVSESKLHELRETVDLNFERYTGEGFQALTKDPGWSIGLEQKVDLSGLEDLDGTDGSAEADLKNTIIIYKVLGELSPSLANEERIWVRLSHVEAFAYSRERWIKKDSKDEVKKAAIKSHFFANTQTGIRDDHALSRLWWNAFIAKRCCPDFFRGLELMLHSADVRSNIVERIWLTGRRQLAAGLFRKMDTDTRVLATEKSFREFMKALNLLGGGVVFETMNDHQINDFLTRCVDHSLAAI